MNRIVYRFKEFHGHQHMFHGLTREEFEAFFRHVEKITRNRFIPGKKVLVAASFWTRLGVIDCFVN